MSEFAYRDADGWVNLVEGGIVTTLASAEGDTPAHARLQAFIDGGGEIADGPPPPPPMDAEQLAAFKAQRRREIDDAAELERLKYITGGAGQAMTYQRKVEEARRAETAQDPQPIDYPLLAASLGIDGATVAQVATLVLMMDEQWAEIGAGIEAARLGAKQAVAEAVTDAEVRAIQPIWPGS